MKKYKINTQPATEPLTLAELKAFLRIDSTDEDTYLTSLITTARTTCEQYTGLSFITQKWDLSVDLLFRATYLSKYPLQSVDSVKTYDEDNNESIIDSANYRLDTIANRFVFDEEYEFDGEYRAEAPLKITYTAGYGDNASDVPEPIKQAILTLASGIYENRAACSDMPVICKTMLDPYRDVAKLGIWY